jgi:Spy/CpxP family protein refolding chaperone
MKYSVLPTILTLFLSAVVAQGQTPSAAEQDQLRAEMQRLIQGFQQQVQQGGGGRGAAPGAATPFGSVQVRQYLPGAWWTNANLVTQLGLTDDQKTKIEKVYENHKANIAMDSTTVTAQEMKLSELLAVDPVDHNAVLGQIDRVAQARADLERTNSAMTLEMREVLTATQWAKLPSQPIWFSGDFGSRLVYTPFGATPSPNPNGGPGQRNGGGQRGGQRQQ